MVETYEECYNRVLGQKGRRVGNQLYYHCPFDGCVSYEKRKFNINPELGGFHCFHCEEGGSHIEFAERMGDDITLWPSGRVERVAPKISPLTEKQRRKVWTDLFSLSVVDIPDSLSKEHKKELECRGIDYTKTNMISSSDRLFERMVETHGQNTIIRAGIGYLNKDILLPRLCVQSNRLLIPYVENEEVFYFVGYAKCPTKQDTQTIEEYQNIKQNWTKVASPAGYSPAIYGYIPNNSEYIIISEGQFKTEAA